MSELPPKSPRFKNPKAQGVEPKIVQRTLGEPSRISEGVPDNFKLAMASALMAYSEMEMSAEHFIWDILGLSIDDGKLLTQIDSKEKFELAKKLSERYALPVHGHPDTRRDIWTTIRLIIEARNKMAHGVWRMIDGITPIIVSYRIPIDPGEVNSEHFPIDRIESIAMTCLKVKNIFDALCRQITASPTKPKSQVGSGEILTRGSLGFYS